MCVCRLILIRTLISIRNLTLTLTNLFDVVDDDDDSNPI